MSGVLTRVPETSFPKYEPLAETIERVVESINKRDGKPEIETGVAVLDRGIYGLHRAQLTIIAARPGSGKTSFAAQVAFNIVIKGYKVAIISLEVSKEMMLEKIFCIAKRVDSRRVQRNDLNEQERIKLRLYADEIKSLDNFRIIDDYCFTENQLFTLFEHLEFKPDVLLIDHVQHIRMSDKKLPEREVLNNYLMYLKEIAMSKKIAVMCLSQINRQGDDKPTLANLKGSGKLEEIADQVIIMHPKETPTTFTANEKVLLSDVVMDIAKNRYGPVGYFEMLWEKPTGCFFEKARDVQAS